MNRPILEGVSIVLMGMGVIYCFVGLISTFTDYDPDSLTQGLLCLILAHSMNPKLAE